MFADWPKPLCFRRLGCADIAMAQKRDGFVYPQCVYIVAEVDFKLAAEYVRNIAFAYIRAFATSSKVIS